MISSEVLLKELEAGRDYLDKWVQKVREGVPGIDLAPSGDSDENFEKFMREMYAELRVVSGKCDTLAEITADMLQGG